MAISRQQFIAASAAAGAAALNGGCSSIPREESSRQTVDYAVLDEILKKPVLDRSFFPEPVIIESLELLQDRNNFICRARSRDGAEGISVSHPNIAKAGYPLFKVMLHQQFVGKDARDLDDLVYNASLGRAKFQGVPTKIQIATIEFAVLDMLGNTASQPIGALLGGVRNPEVGIYLGTRLADLRKKEPEVSLELMAQDVRDSHARAIKLRAGIGNERATDKDHVPGRTEKLIRMAREKFGDEMVIMMDANGNYSIEGAIRIGRLLEEYDYYFFEAPLPWAWHEELRPVQDALSIPLASGEIESRMYDFRWLIANGVLQIVQPDTFYFGGMIRSIKVARMAEAAGMTISPHLSSGGLGYFYMLHTVSAAPAADRFHEFKMFTTRDANGTPIPWESKSGPIRCVDGKVNVPTGPGLGIRIDPDYVKTHQPYHG